MDEAWSEPSEVTMVDDMLSRRGILRSALAGCTASLGGRVLRAADVPASRPQLDFTLTDFHVHLDNSSIEQVLPLSRERRVRFGIVEHAGTPENVYPVVLSNDDQLRAYVKKLDGKGVYKGVQAEYSDWAGCFSREALAELDYVLTDTMTFPGKDGRRVKLWEPGVEDRVEMSDRQAFMDRFVDWHVQLMTTAPIDILANTSWLPAPLADEYDRFWTEARIQKVAGTAVKHKVALEISTGFKLPNLRFLRIAKDVGVKFSLGSNGRYPKMGLLDFSIDMARQLGLTRADMFTPTASCRNKLQTRPA
jgi:histidinol phosphatase-like PHP family hydrolase